ncbi:MAG TPA: AsmA family protein, partial [Hyphomicrobiaceae bacterium]|nr:AsmA family protein [Hyphomicrobiaceae bacterium]
MTARPAQRAARGTGRWLPLAGYALLALAGLAAAALAVLLMAPPLDLVRDRLIRQVEARTGRTLTVGGPISVTLRPRAVVSIHNVALGAPRGMPGPPTVVVPAIDVEMSLWSLLARRPQLDRLTLHRPAVDLVIDAEGRRNWGAGTAKPEPTARPATSAGAGQRDASPAPIRKARRQRTARPITLHVVDGTVRFRDARNGTGHDIGGINLELMLDDPAGAARAVGTLTWLGLPFEFSATATPARETTGGRGAAQVTLALVGPRIDATYEGTLTIGEAVATTGTVSIKRLAYENWRLGPGSLGVDADAGIAKLTVRDLGLYGGRANGTVTLDMTGTTRAVKTDLHLTGIAVQPLLKDAAGVDWLDGTGTLNLALEALGLSEPELLQSLRGRVQLAVADGGVSGLDVDRSLRELQRGRLDRLAPRRGDRTLFQTLSASFDIAEGIAGNEDLKLVSTHVRLEGAGKIELGPRRIDYTLQTRIEGGAPAQGGGIGIGTLEVPVAITGALDRPRFSIKGQEELTDTLEKIGRNLKSREVQDAIQGLLSGDKSKRVKPADLLEQLLKSERRCGTQRSSAATLQQAFENFWSQRPKISCGLGALVSYDRTP